MEELLQLMKHKLRISDDSEDTILEIYLNTACSFINNLRRFTPTEELVVENRYKFLAVDLAIASYLKEGAEGEISHSENGISRTYDSSYYPLDLVSKIIPVVKVYENIEA